MWVFTEQYPCQHAGNGFHKKLSLSVIPVAEHFLLSAMGGEDAASSRPSRDGLHKPHLYQPCLGFTPVALRYPERKKMPLGPL